MGFSPPDAAKIQPDTGSLVLVISTDATTFGPGNVSVIDGGVSSVASFQPTPEPATLMTLGLGALALLRRLKAR